MKRYFAASCLFFVNSDSCRVYSLKLNFLSSGDVVLSSASDFVGSVVGESQKKANAMLEKARGKVLVIDEAYNLDDNLYGKQARPVFFHLSVINNDFCAEVDTMLVLARCTLLIIKVAKKIILPAFTTQMEALIILGQASLLRKSSDYGFAEPPA